MKILYGVAGEGKGHATRSKVVITHLRARGHEVRIAVSGRACSMLRRAFPKDVVEIEGLGFAYRDGAVEIASTVLQNAARLPRMLAHNAAALAALDRFAPDAVVSDFEPFTCGYGHANGLPVLSIDNNQMLARCAHDPDALSPDTAADLDGARAMAALMTPGCAHYVITTFFYPPIRPECRDTTTLIPPIVRHEIADAARTPPAQRNHALVYQTAVGDARLLDVLAAHPRQRFVVYGLRVEETTVYGNCAIKPFDERTFVDDLASARAVITNGGMSLLGEAVYLCKPIYSVPVRHQPEQALNADYVAALGYGVASPQFDAALLGEFLRDAPDYAARVRASFLPDGNRMLYDVVDQLLARVSTRATGTAA